MIPSQFESLIESVEETAARSPGRYRSLLAGMALLGYVYIAGVLLVLLGCVALLMWGIISGGTGAVVLIKTVGIPLVAVVVLVVRSMWVKLDPPQGVPLARNDVPALFDAIDTVRDRVHGPRIHEVIATDDFNAAVVQHPRLGIFGFPRNYLVLGLPLMQALSPDEFRAVLAHEIGHLARSHGKFGAWIYRLRAGWAQLADVLAEERHWASFLFVPFFSWYAPRFAAYSFVQARSQEYEADRLSAAVVGKELSASALLRLRVESDRLGQFWQEVFRKAEAHDRPVDAPFSQLEEIFRSATPDAQASLVIQRELRARTGRQDTHPSLSDRLAALGAPAENPGAKSESAASTFLGPVSQQLAADFDDQWRNRVSHWWQERHVGIAAARGRLSELRGKVRDQGATAEEEWELATTAEALGARDEAIAAFGTVLARNPDHVEAHTALGRLLLLEGNEGGIRHYTEAFNRDSLLTLEACDHISDFLRARGRADEAERYSDLALKSADQLELAREERKHASDKDQFVPHGLDPAEVARLTKDISRHGDVRKVWLVRKQVEYFPERPFYVLGVLHAEKWWSFSKSSTAEYLVDALSKIEYPGETYIAALYGSNRRLKSALKAVPGSELI